VIYFSISVQFILKAARVQWRALCKSDPVSASRTGTAQTHDCLCSCTQASGVRPSGTYGIYLLCWEADTSAIRFIRLLIIADLIASLSSLEKTEPIGGTARGYETRDTCKDALLQHIKLYQPKAVCSSNWPRSARLLLISSETVSGFSNRPGSPPYH
jgi:hypothetical protein